MLEKLIDLNNYPVSVVLKSLIKDKTTGKNIILATTIYTKNGIVINETEQITPELLKMYGSEMIQPRVTKSIEEQTKRTRKKAEVFTPSWVCNKMNNYCDTEWFGHDNVFNIEDGQKWTPTKEPVKFEKTDAWKEYIDSKRLEITCGEAPFLVSRYDTTTGELIPINRRIGILDRKLRIINENTYNETDWLKWTFRAFQSVYGYEFQGDNLLIARINLLVSFVEYMQNRWDKQPSESELKEITNIIVWNLWQMDGLTGTIPFKKPRKDQEATLIDFGLGSDDTESEGENCIVYDWINKNSLTFRSIKGDK